MAKYDLKSVDELIEAAERAGAEKHFFFVTTLDRYQTQLNMLESFKESMEADGVLVTKEYVKGRTNLYAHPAASEYNKTAQAANNTVKTLMDIIKTLDAYSIMDGADEDDEL